MYSFSKIKTFGIDLLFPKFCLGCQKEGSFLCEDCRELLDIAAYHYCLCEKNPIRISHNSKSGKCIRCQNFSLSGLYFALSYKEKALTRKLIYQFKYQPYLKNLAEVFAGILAEHFFKTGKNTNEVWENSVLLPVPLDKKKFKTRGYNQSEELARELSKIVEIPFFTDVLIKTKITKSQMELSRAERETNLKNAFEVKDKEKISGKKVFLVDDVYTTGFTMQECSILLKKHGAKSIWGIAIAREG